MTRVLEQLTQMDISYLVLLLVLSVLLPLSIFSGYGRVRAGRLALLDILKGCAEDADPKCKPFVLKALHFVRARYASSKASRSGWWLGWLSYIMPTTLFVLLSAVGFYTLFAAVTMTGLGKPNLFLIAISASAPPAVYQAGTAAVVAAAFLGAYIWSINYLVLRVANFDLNPLSFLRVSAHILLTILVAGILRHVVASGLEAGSQAGLTEAGPGAGLTLGLVLGIAFVMGLFPTLGVSVLIDRLPAWLRIKRPVAQAAEIAREFPLDLIDGIDPATKFRLAALEIVDAQGLATADPIVVYLESPYGFLQILDWIAQAQLLTALGPEKYLACRELNVRDVHALLATGRTEHGRDMLKPALFKDANASEQAAALAVQSIGDMLHVQRLGHWWSAFTSIMHAPPYERPASLRVVQPDDAA